MVERNRRIEDLMIEIAHLLGIRRVLLTRLDDGGMTMRIFDEDLVTAEVAMESIKERLGDEWSPYR